MKRLKVRISLRFRKNNACQQNYFFSAKSSSKLSYPTFFRHLKIISKNYTKTRYDLHRVQEKLVTFNDLLFPSLLVLLSVVLESYWQAYGHWPYGIFSQGTYGLWLDLPQYGFFVSLKLWKSYYLLSFLMPYFRFKKALFFLNSIEQKKDSTL